MEGAVQLVAEAATVPANDLLHEAPRIEDDLAPQADVQILERNGQHVLAVECAQGVGGRLNRAAVADAVEIGTNIHQCTSSRANQLRAGADSIFLDPGAGEARPRGCGSLSRSLVAFRDCRAPRSHK